MQIIKRSPEQLTLANRTDGTGGRTSLILFGLGFGGIPLIMGLGLNYSLSVMELNCRGTGRQMADCRVKEAKFWGLAPAEERTIQGITQAKLNSRESTDSDGDRQVEHWVSIVTKAGDQVLVNGTSGNYTEMNRLTNELNSRLRTNQSTFVAIYDDRKDISIGLINLFILPFILIGFSLVISALKPLKDEVLIFDKRRRVMVWTLVTEELPAEYSLDQVSAVEVHQAKIEGQREEWQVYAVLQGRGLVILGEGFQQKKASELGKQISEFLRVPVHQRVV